MIAETWVLTDEPFGLYVGDNGYVQTDPIKGFGMRREAEFDQAGTTINADTDLKE